MFDEELLSRLERKKSSNLSEESPFISRSLSTPSPDLANSQAASTDEALSEISLTTVLKLLDGDSNAYSSVVHSQGTNGKRSASIPSKGGSYESRKSLRTTLKELAKKSIGRRGSTPSLSLPKFAQEKRRGSIKNMFNAFSNVMSSDVA